MADEIGVGIDAETRSELQSLLMKVQKGPGRPMAGSRRRYVERWQKRIRSEFNSIMNIYHSERLPKLQEARVAAIHQEQQQRQLEQSQQFYQTQVLETMKEDASAGWRLVNRLLPEHLPPGAYDILRARALALATEEERLEKMEDVGKDLERRQRELTIERLEREAKEPTLEERQRALHGEVLDFITTLEGLDWATAYDVAEDWVKEKQAEGLDVKAIIVILKKYLRAKNLKESEERAARKRQITWQEEQKQISREKELREERKVGLEARRLAITEE